MLNNDIMYKSATPMILKKDKMPVPKNNKLQTVN